MKEGNIFQTVFIGVFIGLGVLGLIFFASTKSTPDDSPDNIGNVTIWGTVDKAIMDAVILAMKEQLPKNFQGSLKYRELDETRANEELLEALASGTGPDVFLLEHQDIVKHVNKMFVIPYENYSERQFQDTFVEGAEIFKDATGVIALPFMTDPLVLYWNRDILTRNGISEVPEYWDEFFTLSPKLTKRDSSANILQATIALGEYRNISNAKEIVSALILQADNNIVVRGFQNEPMVVLEAGTGEDDDAQPAASALRFYTEFSNPIKSVYSWNRALKESRQAFIAGDLAFYIGFASELQELRRQNPNLNFDVAVLPQIRDDRTPNTFSNMTGAAIVRSSPNIRGSFRVVSMLSGIPVLEVLNEQTGLPPVSRRLLSQPPGDAVSPVFYESALIGRAWLEPDRESVDTIFRDMIEAISSGRQSISRAVADAQDEIERLLSK